MPVESTLASYRHVILRAQILPYCMIFQHKAYVGSMVPNNGCLPLYIWGNKLLHILMSSGQISWDFSFFFYRGGQCLIPNAGMSWT